MGILDDAIRQHLELKRQHGAPEEELQRQEEEALGPARRDVAPAEPSGGDGDVELEVAEAPSEEETELFEPAPEELETMLEEPEGEPAAGTDASFEPESEPAAGREMPFDPAEEPESGDEPELEGVPEPESMPASEAPVDADTAFEGLGQHDEPDEEEPEDEDEPDRDEADVLEDTPDFLQETPEHDRLWFEQKPPRDFDFD
jgi:hypothetical protein